MFDVISLIQILCKIQMNSLCFYHFKKHGFMCIVTHLHTLCGRQFHKQLNKTCCRSKIWEIFSPNFQKPWKISCQRFWKSKHSAIHMSLFKILILTLKFRSSLFDLVLSLGLSPSLCLWLEWVGTCRIVNLWPTIWSD